MSPAHARQLVLPFPVIDNDQLAKIVHINADGDLPGYATYVVRGLYEVNGGAEAMRARLEEIFLEVSQAIAAAPGSSCCPTATPAATCAPIPSLLLTSAVHHHLIREKTRTRVGLLVEAGDVREVHHVALLVGYGAAAVNPYLAMESVEDLVRPATITGVAPEKAVANLIKALGKGVLKVMSKMGISTVASYRGAQVFEAIGLSQRARRPLLHRHDDASSAVSTSRSSPRRSPPGTRWPTRARASARRTASSGSAASTSGAARASRTCSTRRRCSGCSTPPARGATTSSSSTPRGSTSRPSG